MATRKAAAKSIGDVPAKDIAAKAETKAQTAEQKANVARDTKEVKAAVKEATKSAGVKLSIPLDSPAAAVDKLIKSIQQRGTKLDIDLHSAACAALNHVALHNDPTLLNRLVSAMPKSGRANAVITWALKHGNVALNEGNDKDTRHLVYMKEKAHDIPAAVAEPFWEMRNVREGGGKAWLYNDYITNVMKQLARASMDPQSAEAKKAKAALDALTAVNEAINTPTNGAAPTWTPGMQDRRAERTEDAAAPAQVH